MSEQKSKAGSFITTLLLLAAAGGAGWWLAQPPADKENVDAPADTAVKSRTRTRVVKVPKGAYKPHYDTPLSLSDDSKRYLLDYGRALCDGQKDKAKALVRPAELNSVTAPVLIALYAEAGGRAAYRRVDGKQTTVAKLEKAVPKLCSSAERRAHYLHLAVVSYTARVPNFGIKGVFDPPTFEAQVNGLAYEIDGKRAELDPLQQVERNMGPKMVRAQLAKGVGLNPKRAPSNNALIMEIYEVIHFGEALGHRRFTEFFRGHPKLRAEDITDALLLERLKYVGQYYKNNVIDGQVTYEYRTSKGEYRNRKRTMVRSNMTTWVLNRLAVHLKDDSLKALALVPVEYYFEHYYRMKASLAAGVLQPSETPIASGNIVRNRYTAASFMGAALLERDDWQKYRDEAELLIRFAMQFKRNDGVMWTQYGNSQFFMPGQLLLAVAYAWEKTEDDSYRIWFDQVFEVYSSALKQLIYLGNKRYTPYAPAWFTQPAAHMHLLTGEAKYRDLVYQINDNLVRHYAHNAREIRHYDYDGAMIPKLGYYGNNSITAAGLESLVDAALVARRDKDDRRFRTYVRAVRRITAYLMRLQFIPENTYYIKKRERVIGGFRKDLLNTDLWMDNVWHLTSAFVKIHRAKLLTASADMPAPDLSTWVDWADERHPDAPAVVVPVNDGSADAP